MTATKQEISPESSLTFTFTQQSVWSSLGTGGETAVVILDQTNESVKEMKQLLGRL